MATLNAASGQRLLDTGQHSDFTIECKGQIWKTHKIILAPISPFLDQACNGNFRETADSRLVLNEEDPLILGLVLKWLYTNTYLPPAFGDPADPRRVQNHAEHQTYLEEACLEHLTTLIKVYTLADKLLLADLKTLCIRESYYPFINILTHSGPVHIVLEQVFANTTASDPLRAMTLETSVRFHTQLQYDPLATAVLQHHEPLSYNLGVKLTQENTALSQQNATDTTEITRLTKANEAHRTAHTTLVQRVLAADNKLERTMRSVRKFLGDETVCTRCGCAVTKQRMLLRILSAVYAMDCPQCRQRLWSAGKV